MQGRKHQVPRERGLNSHFTRISVPDFTDHDDVWVLPEKSANRVSKRNLRFAADLHLIQFFIHDLDGVFNSAYIYVFFGDKPQRSMQGSRLSGTRWTGNQYQAVRQVDESLPFVDIFIGETQFFESLG